MINKETMFNVKNRSSSVVVYRVPDLNLHREFGPGETKRISFGELEKLTYQPGGKELLENFLQIMEQEVTSNLSINREVEYNMSEKQVQDLLLHGSLDAFLDALDFAPIGVIDLIKVYAVKLPLSDRNKIRALKEKTGFDVSKALIHIEEEIAEGQRSGQKTATRRVQTSEQAAEATPSAPVRRVIRKTEPVIEESQDTVEEPKAE